MPILRFVRDKSPDSHVITAGRGEPIPFVAVTGGLKGDGINTADLPWNFGRGELRDNGWSRFPLLWVHDFGGQRLPLGVTDVRMRNDGTTIEANAIFDPEDAFAVEVERKYLSDVGGLRGFSASWDDIGADGVPVRGTGGRPVAHELLEVSAVPVGLDPLAVKGGRGLPQSLARLRAMIDALEESEAADAEPTTADGAEAVDAITDTDSETECECDGGCCDATDDGDAEDEDALADLAAGMVDVFDPASDDSDAVRGRRYRALLPGYRRAGWTPPELLPVDELRALDSDVWAGLFVSGELERLERAARVGKELSSANLAGLKDAIDRIDEGVTSIRALVKRVEAGAERAAVDAPPADDFERALSDALAARLAVV